MTISMHTTSQHVILKGRPHSSYKDKDEFLTRKHGLGPGSGNY